MKKLDIKEIIFSKYPDFLKNFPRIVRNSIFIGFNKLLHFSEINRFLEKAEGKYGLDFIDEVFEYLDFSYILSSRDRDRIKSEGRLLIIANHPLGGLDGLVLIKLISEIRQDVKIVVNDYLLNIEELNSFFLPYDLSKPKVQSKNVKVILDALNREQAVIIFPAGVVSRFSLKGIKDAKWNKGFLFFARATNSPLLPIFIHGRNSSLFYFTALFSDVLSMLLLPHELFNKRNTSIRIKIGNLIPTSSFLKNTQDDKLVIKLLKKHLHRMANDKKGIFRTEKNIIHPVGKKELKKQICSSNILGTTSDGKLIIIADNNNTPDVLKEIGRLREITFRRVGEGTGNKVDLDYYDKLYKHIVLWDEAELEIVGAYRIADCGSIYSEHKLFGLYTASLFNFTGDLVEKLPTALELGRSFVHPKYWNSNALDYLWQGIGSYLAVNPQIKYLFGPVSISNSYSPEARELLVYFFKKWFKPDLSSAVAKNPFIISKVRGKEIDTIFNSVTYKSEYLTLKNHLKILGYSIPVLLKQYTELCETGGVQIHDFSIDPNFENSVDGLIVVEVEKIKEVKRNRYIKSNYTKAM